MEAMDRDSTGEDERQDEPRREYIEVLEADADVRAHTQPRLTSDAIREAVRQRMARQR